VRLDELLTQIRTYAETHAKAQSCRATAGHSTMPADRANLNARADFWTQEAAGQYAAITELLAEETASTLYATPDAFMPVRLPGPDLRHIELRGMFSDGDRTVTITFDLTQAVTAATLMIALAGIGNDRTGGPIGALVPSMPTAAPS
jgi:hypothetical protein